MIKSFTDLNVWQEGHSLTLEIYKVCKNFPKEEVYGLSSQLKRAAISITSNISEGFGRSSSKDRHHFWVMADGSCYEVKNQLILARDLKYISIAEYQSLLLKEDNTHKLLHGLLRSHNV
ncbi:MAG: four helix bundle protein [Patescibacteria group bacterium]|jgi:four helix bundle protein|nr:four helix bundle protein [Patescibacteria group bacterium]